VSLIDKTETHPIQFCFKGLKLFVSRNETQYFNKMRKDNVTMLKIKWL